MRAKRRGATALDMPLTRRRIRLGTRCRRRPLVAAKIMPLMAQGVYQRAVVKGETWRTSSMLRGC
jgi:hypothetical protein